MRIELTEAQTKAYYREILGGDGVCTITEDEFVKDYQLFKDEGKQLGLKEFTGSATMIDMARTLMIDEAQKLGQLTYQPVVVANLI